MQTLIMKFGGSTIGDAAALTQVAGIILQERERWDRLALVVSALDGVTDNLIEAAHLAQMGNRRGYRRIIGTLRTRHLALVEQLNLETNEQMSLQVDLDRLLYDILDVCQWLSEHASESDAVLGKIDTIISGGERLAARIVAALLRHNKIRGVAQDAIDLIITDDQFSNARPNWEETQHQIQQHLIPILESNIIPVITGFLGGTLTKQITTLGRGGSDYSASILARCLNAAEVWIWTDVDGMMTADPRELPDARLIAEFSYGEAATFAYFGARILHARMIVPLREANIPLRIKNIYKPQQPGTLIHQTATPAQPIKAVTFIEGIGITTPTNGSLATLLTQVDKAFDEYISSSAEIIITSQSLASTFIGFLIPTTAGPEAPHLLNAKLDEALRQPELMLSGWQLHPIYIITVIIETGAFPQHTSAAALAALGDLPVYGISFGMNQHNLSFAIAPRHVEAAMERIHQLILTQ